MIRAEIPAIGAAELLDPFDPRGWCGGASEPCYIHLSDRFDVYAVVDPEDYAWAREHRWCHTYGSGSISEKFDGIFVIDRPEGMYARRCVGGRTLYLHREILTRRDGAPRCRTTVGDHLNGRTLDCRRVNLRWASPSQNSRNTAGSKTRAAFLHAMGVPR